MSSGGDQAALVAELAGQWTAGLDGARQADAERLLQELVSDWAEDAAASPDPSGVLAIQRRDLEAAGAGKDAAGRFELLKRLLLQRRVERLGSATFALGIEILDGKIDAEGGRERGRTLLTQAEEIGAEVKVLPQDAESLPLRRELSDAVMEALFAVEGKAMSARLDRERADRQGGPSSAPRVS